MADEYGSRAAELRAAFGRTVGKIDKAAETEFIHDLVEATKEPLKKIPEPVFREIFLPYFSGEKKPTEENPVMANWLGLVGGGTSEAEVVNTQGETLFVVPALYDSSTIPSGHKSRKGTNFFTIFTEFQEEAKKHPDLGRNYLIDELSQKADAVLPDNTKKANGWIPILKHYKLLDPATDKPIVKTAPNDDGFDFD